MRNESEELGVRSEELRYKNPLDFCLNKLETRSTKNLANLIK